MPSRNISAQCSTRRKHSLGQLRRAYPASGASWNVQVVRGKMSSKCLWHACRALVLGLVLMIVGAGMATVGYYADHLSIGSLIRGNSTIRYKNESKGFHLNNLSYVGPIVMGFGGFIVVASCVMTFEARDSAAKVVPARPKTTNNSKTNTRSNPNSGTSQRRANGVTSQYQSTRWDHHMGVFRSSPAEPPPPAVPFDRQALTAALVHFSKTIGNSSRLSPKLARVSFSGSVPNLTSHSPHSPSQTNLSYLLSPNRKTSHLVQNSYRRHRHHYAHQSHQSGNGRHLKSRGGRISTSLVQRTTRESTSSSLQPITMHKHYWHAMSIDETGRNEGQASRILDRTKRSDTAKKHILARQKQIDNLEDKRNESPPIGKRRSSTISDSSFSGRRMFRCASVNSRTPSIDSRKIQVDLHSPDGHKSILRSPKRFSSAQSSTPSVEREFRSQLSVCSEPVTARQLSGQSSLEPCVPEESAEIDEKPYITTDDVIASGSDNIAADTTTCSASPTYIIPSTVPPIDVAKKLRPDTLLLFKPNGRKNFADINSKLLQRSNSSLTFYRPKAKIANEYDSIISMRSFEKPSLCNSNELYDSLQVINERRKKILKTESEKDLDLTETTCLSYSATNLEFKAERGSGTGDESRVDDTIL